MNNETLKTNTLTYSSTIRKLISTLPFSALSESFKPKGFVGAVYQSSKDLNLTPSFLNRLIKVEARLGAKRLSNQNHVGNRKSKIVN
ncbi:hypothetical protein DHW03_17360 [Pedobacter yonginense]|uniref:Uncharacterized protein n=1 Tax=Pedobacter yonginense TaxID=651869 RepID=A0A317EI98_9SPHI|nr:hypothetical protein [Pedobacter yonginense]PWS26540.1 hypothetical protein DHW03_17360 [Pedobacter yonginense]